MDRKPQQVLSQYADLERQDRMTGLGCHRLKMGAPMSLSDLASLGSFASGVAVTISLVYLALQVRQGEKNQRALMQQGRADRLLDMQLRLATAELGALYMKGSQGMDLNDVEFVRYRFITRAQMTASEDSFYQHKNGMLQEASFRSSREAAKIAMAEPGRRAMWRLERDRYQSDFQAYVDELVSEKVQVRKAVAAWRTALAAQTEQA
jgi:hypothetical protein